MPTSDVDIISRYGKTCFAKGSDLFKRGRVSTPKAVGVGVYSVDVRTSYGRETVLVWNEGNGRLCARRVGNIYVDGSIEAAALVACYNLKAGQGDDDDFPSRLTSSPIYEEYLEHGGDEDEIDELCDRVVDDLIRGLSREDSLTILDTIDAAVDRSYGNWEHNTVRLAKRLESRARKLRDVIEKAKPRDISQILCRSDRIFSRRWLAECRLSSDQALMAFIDLSERRSLNSNDMAVLSVLLRKLDAAEYAEIVTDDLGYYDMERIALREFRRGHKDTAVAVAKMFSGAKDFQEHLTEAGRVRQSMGLGDDEDVFVRAFVSDPNEKRLLDLVANHGTEHLDDVMRRSWESSEHTPRNLIFFARNGLDGEVARFLSDNPGWENGCMDEDEDTIQLLGEVLKDSGHHSMSARLLTAVLDRCASEKGEENVAVHIMNILDSEYDEAEGVLSSYCSEFRSKHRNRALWEAYGDTGHF